MNKYINGYINYDYLEKILKENKKYDKGHGPFRSTTGQLVDKAIELMKKDDIKYKK